MNLPFVSVYITLTFARLLLSALYCHGYSKFGSGPGGGGGGVPPPPLPNYGPDFLNEVLVLVISRKIKMSVCDATGHHLCLRLGLKSYQLARQKRLLKDLRSMIWCQRSSHCMKVHRRKCADYYPFIRTLGNVVFVDYALTTVIFVFTNAQLWLVNFQCCFTGFTLMP